MTVGLTSLMHLLAGAQPAGAQAPSIPDTGRAAIDGYLDQVVRDTYIPGVVALVTNRDGVIYAGAFGSRNVAQGVPMTVDSIFRIASMTKPITSAAVMMLVEEGEVGLDDPASMYLPGRLPVEVFETFDPTDNSFTSRPFPLGAGADTFGLCFQITAGHDSATMRSPGSLSWAGINNTQFWIDPDAGIGAVLLMQYRPFYDDTAIEALQGFEARVYEYLQ